MSEIYLKRDNSLEVHYKLPDHWEVLHLIQKVNETLWKAIETLFQQLCYFHLTFGILCTLLLRHLYSNEEEEPL